MKEQKHIVSFSGGKDSTALLCLMIEKGMKIDEIVCIDTGMEFPEMYEHIEKVKEYIKPYEITVLKSSVTDNDFRYYATEKPITKGKRKGRKGYRWPNSGWRWCTYVLKRDVKNNYFKNKPYLRYEYVGVAVDEKERMMENQHEKEGYKLYPLVDWALTEQDCLQYCYDKGFDWGGLYEKMGRVSCYCCPLSTIKELKTVHDEYPDLWQNMIDIDDKINGRFRSDYSLEQLEDRFKYNSLWNFKDCK